MLSAPAAVYRPRNPQSSDYYRRVENIQGIWSARELDMEDLRRSSHTVLRLEEVRYNVPLGEDDFTVQALRREQ